MSDARAQHQVPAGGSFPRWPFLDTGAVLHGYRIDGLLTTQTSTGFTYEATELSTRSRVALKLLPRYLTRDPAFRERFERDVQVQARIDHPHVLTIQDVGEAGSDLFVAMRLVRGDTLRVLIDSGRLDARRTVRILGPVGDALDAAHTTGLLHCAIKPQSILVGEQDHGFLTDFGLTQLTVRKLIESGELASELAYTAPEQVGGEPPSIEGDIYSLAAVLHECLTGRPPVDGSSRTDARPGIERSIDLRHLGFPSRLEKLMRRGLAPEPGSRPRSAGELMRTAEGAIVRPALRRPTRPVEQSAAAPSRTARRVPGRALVAGAVVAAALAGGFMVGSRGSATPDGARKPGSPAARPSAAYANSLNAAMDTLSAERAVGRKRLNASRTPDQQATGAAGLAKAYERAVSTLDRAASSTGARAANASIAAALQSPARGYRELASAARRRDSARYDRARRDVARGEAALSDRLAALG